MKIENSLKRGIAILILVGLSHPTVLPQITEKDISDLRYEILDQSYYELSKSWRIYLYLPNDQYSRENLIRLWRYYCEKYPDKKEYVLDMRVYTKKQNSDEKATSTSKELLFAAMIIRQGISGLPIPGENELMLYYPDLTNPKEWKREVLAGRDPVPN